MTVAVIAALIANYCVMSRFYLAKQISVPEAIERDAAFAREAFAEEEKMSRRAIIEPLALLHSNPLDKLLSSLPWGNIAYNVPPSIHINTEAQAALHLSPMKSFDELARTFSSGVPLHFGTIQIAPRMKATLSTSSTGIVLTPQSDSIQAVSFVEDTTWNWRLVAKRPGQHRIHIELSILLKIEGEDTYRTIKSYENDILVQASASERVGQFVVDYWQWIATSIALPVVALGFGFLMRRYRARREAVEVEARQRIGFH